MVESEEDKSDVIPVKTSKVKPKSAPKPAASKEKPKPCTANLKVPKARLDHDGKSATSETKPRSAANAKAPTKDASPNTNVLMAASDINTLPEFAWAAWSTTFLPTLYNCLACADNPFVLDTDMVKVIQEILYIVYPDSDYRLKVSDKMYAMVSPLSQVIIMLSSDWYVSR